jgi:lysine 2,3-aminomutase
MRGYTSGLALPTYVIDLPGGGGKVPLQPEYLLSQVGEELTFRNYQGHVFHYRNPKPIGQNSGKNLSRICT